MHTFEWLVTLSPSQRMNLHRHHESLIYNPNPKTFTFNFAPASLRIWSTQFVQDDYQTQLKVVTVFLASLGAHVNTWFLVKVEISLLIERFIMLVIEPRMIDRFRILSTTCHFGCPFLDPRLITHHIDTCGRLGMISDWIRRALETCHSLCSCSFQSVSWNDNFWALTYIITCLRVN